MRTGSRKPARRAHLPPGEAILAALSARAKPLSLQQLASAVHSTQDDPLFRQAVMDLRREGKIYEGRGQRYASASGLGARLGTLRLAERGYGFVAVEGRQDDLYIPAENIGNALDGDTVLVVEQSPRGRRNLSRGVVLGIAYRPERMIVGTFHKGVGFAWIRPFSAQLPDLQLVFLGAEGDEKAPSEGDVITAVLEPLSLESSAPAARFGTALGKQGDPWVDVTAILHAHGIRLSFPAEAVREAQQVAERAAEEAGKRADLRGLETVTIDPSDAADIDDAISLSKDDAERDVVGIHIADVSHFVPEKGAIDKEAYLRGTSVYLPGKVVHMLPPQLAAGLCSLLPRQDRLAVSVLITLDENVLPVRVEILESVIRSCAKISYEEAQEALGGSARPDNPAFPHAGMLQRLADITGELARKRSRHGALDFDVPEVRVEVDAQGRVVALRRRERLDSHRVIEELMLLANSVIADHLSQIHYPLLYRVHAGPDPAKLQELAPLALSLGQVIAPDGRSPSVQDLQKLLDAIRGNPVAPVLEALIIRSLPKAVYQPDNIGHFGLAMDAYTHFTSPIRRYPDLVVHRQLKRALNGTPPCYSHEQLFTIGDHCSAAERTAETAEREAIRAKQAEYLAGRVGEEFDGTVSGVRKFGLFVVLNDSLAEGFVPVDDLPADTYAFDPTSLTLEGRRSRMTFRFGDPVSVQVVRVDVGSRRIDFLLVEAPHSHRTRGPRTKTLRRSSKRPSRPTPGKRRGGRPSR
ncbi:MAG TPA: ribonuclease R [Candidatus Latescibacteria bacterium]|nr:ribonuclease R [Candidatus Latescibacterota bacterium]HOS63948.1 ribonuclease R [Candidatus Latescibacterota bacterium]